VTHYQNDSASGDWLREYAAIRDEDTRPYLQWAGGRNVTVCVGTVPVVTTTYQRARELIEVQA
jgi:hypothetical protein